MIKRNLVNNLYQLIAADNISKTDLQNLYLFTWSSN